jgi:antitoxin (DNA-binding transcriptional repressor) of toxin-antitoxin stability system
MNAKHAEISNARLSRLLKRIESGQGTVLTDAGEPIAYDVARCAVAVSGRLRAREKPFTQDALDDWIDDALDGLDVSAFMSREL